MNEILKNIMWIDGAFDIHEINIEDTGESYLLTIDILKKGENND